jgi:capsular polysaccharide biosynthesis protein
VYTVDRLRHAGRALVRRSPRSADLPLLTRSGQLRGAPWLTDAGSGGRSVALLWHPAAKGVTARWLRAFHCDRVTVLTTAPARAWPDQLARTVPRQVRDLDDLAREVARIGALDVLVDLLPSDHLPSPAVDRIELFKRLFRLLPPGGIYVVDRGVELRGSRGPGTPEWRGLVAGPPPDKPRSRGAVIKTDVARSIRSMQVSRHLVAVRKRGRHVLALRQHDGLDRFLREREPGLSLTTILEKPAGVYVPRARMYEYGAVPPNRWPERIRHPAAEVRHYQGDVLAARNMLLVAGSTVLPDSFRWPTAENMGQPRLQAVTPELARFWPRRVPGPKRRLDGDYYHLDALFSGHFGHVTSETTSRLWGWDAAKREIPDLKAFFHVRHRPRSVPPLEQRLFTAYGIPASDIVGILEPVTVSSLVGATPLWQDEPPFYAHPDIVETWQRLSTGLLDGAAPAEHERIFVSRGPTVGKRRCRNSRSVERFFAERGFHVLYPEQLDLAEQAALFAGARVVAGLAGSGMFNLMHTRRLETTIVLGHNGYTARNEHLYTSVLGGDLHYFWSPGDVPPPPSGGRTMTSFHSTWAFDFANLGADLERVLRSA